MPAWEYIAAKERGEDIRALIDKYNKKPEETAEELPEAEQDAAGEPAEEDAGEPAQEAPPQEESKGE